MYLRRFGALISVLTIGSLAFAGTAAADPPYMLDIAVTAAFDQAAYNSDDHVGVDVTITNNGTITQDVGGYERSVDGELRLDDDSRAVLDQGFTLDPGASRTVHVTGVIKTTTADHQVVFSVVYNSWSDDNPDDNTATISAPVTQLYGAVDGQVRTDAGVPLAGVTARLADYETLNSVTVLTDADGRFHFDPVTTGTYYLTFESPDGWVFHTSNDIVEVTHLGLTMDATATRPLSDTLHATASMNKPRYVAGATVKVTVKIHNTGDTDVQGLSALYGGAGTDADLAYVNCGALDTGMDVPAYQTVTVKCTGIVTHKAAVLGLVRFTADLFTGNEYSGPLVSVTARVGNHLGYADLQLVNDDEGVAGAQASLIDPNTGGVVARATSDADGNFTIKDIPTGEYQVRVASPWKTDGKRTVLVTTKGACGVSCGRWTVLVVPRAA